MLLSFEMESSVKSGVIVPRWLVWIKAKRNATGAVEAAGYWTGEGPLTVSINGQNRTYTGAGGLVSIDPLEYEAGATVQMRRGSFSMVSPQIIAAVYEYDLRLAPVEIHLALFDPDSEELIGTAKAFSGWVEESEVSDGMRPTLTLGFASSARAGTKTLASKKSAASQRERLFDDRGRDYADLAGNVQVKWGGEYKDGYFVGKRLPDWIKNRGNLPLNPF